MYVITGEYQNKRIKRIAYSEFQAFTIINQLNREGVKSIGMHEQGKESEEL
jgi:hypothetical protein